MNIFEPSSDTRARILAAAEELFAAKGWEHTSMRELTAAAGVNVAAVNYHFRSKDKLVEELFDRLTARVNSARLDALQKYLDQTREREEPPRLESILRAFISPYFDPVQGPRGGQLLARLVLQQRLQPTEVTDRIYQRHFDPLARRFIEALSAAVPEIPIVEWYWRYTFMVSAVILTATDLSSDNRLARLSGGKATATDREELERYLVDFLAGGLMAASKSTRLLGRRRVRRS